MADNMVLHWHNVFFWLLTHTKHDKESISKSMSASKTQQIQKIWKAFK